MVAKLGFVADVHIGNHKRFGGPKSRGINQRCEMVLEVFGNAVDRAVTEGCNALFVLGDLFDVTRPAPSIIAATMRVLMRAGDMPVHILVGNHDQESDARDHHACAPLGLMDQAINVIESPRVVTFNGVAVLAVPFCDGDAEKWLEPVVKKLCVGLKEKFPRILVMHLGIRDDDTVHYLQGALDAINAQTIVDIADRHGFRSVFAGNWHDRREWAMSWPQTDKDGNVETNDVLRIMQLGALVPTGFDNPGIKGYGTLAIWKGAKQTPTIIELPGPRFIKCTSVPDIVGKDNKVYLNVSAPPKRVPFVQAAIDEMKEKKTIIDGVVVPDQKAAIETAKSAAEAATSAATLDDALSSFVEKMQVDPGIDRAAVLAKAKSYLAGASCD